MGKGKTIGYTIGGILIGLFVCVILTIIVGGSRGLLKEYSLSWIVDVLIVAVFGIVIFRYIQKKIKSKKG